MRLRELPKCVADFCYPPICALCGGAGISPPLCENCNADLRRLAIATACGSCGYPLVHIGDPCPHCHGKGIAPIQRVARLGVFSDPLRTLVHRMKYRHGWPFAELLADRLAAHDPAKTVLEQSDCLVAIPLHPLRQWGRGYNQAAVIAERLGHRCKKPMRTPLVRLRNTHSQTTLHAQAKRFENLRDAFGLIDGKCVRGQRVVLVDDVMTTGATLRSAARTLLKAEPAGIDVLVVAVADPKGRAYEAI
jgi:ComF family protein